MDNLSDYAIGVDIGGTNIRIAIMRNHKIIGKVKKFKFASYPDVTVEVEKNVCLPILNLIKKLGINIEEINGVGISLAALFDRNSGDIIKWPNHPSWDGFSFKKYIEDRLKVSVILEDDANAAALGEHIMGAGRNHENFAYITISTGIGCGLILNNRLYIGSRGWAGELGHVPLNHCEVPCKCGATGCFQAVASGTALFQKFLTDVQFKKEKYSNITELSQVVDLANQGEDLAIKLFEECGYYVGSTLTSISMLLDLSLIVLGGGVINAGDILLQSIKENINKHLQHFHKSIEIKTTELKDDSGVMGALSLVNYYLKEGHRNV